MRTQPNFGNDAERSFAANKQRCQVWSSRACGLGAGRNNRAIGQHYFEAGTLTDEELLVQVGL